MREKHRQARIDRGDCHYCGCRRAKPGCVSCTHCLREQALTTADRRAERKEQDRCPDCGSRWKVPSRWGCARCMKKHREATARYKERKERRVSNGQAS